MEARIRQEVVDFLETTGIPACRLAQESQVLLSNISRLKSGKRKDILSRHADALREAMARLAATPPPSTPSTPDKDAPHE